MKKPWTRPDLAARAPNRAFGGLVRTADVERGSSTLAGVPLQTVSDAVLATVKLGYQVADRQIERGRRLGRSLQGAARRAGVDEPNELIDNGERLLLRALAQGLDWVESAATDEQGPLRRLARSEYRLLGRVLGLLDVEAGIGKATPAAAASSPSRPARAEPEPATAAAATSAPAVVLPVRHQGKPEERKAVRVLQAQWRDLGEQTLALWFHHREQPGAPSLPAQLQIQGQQPVLIVHTGREHPAGRWRAVVCDAADLQAGSIEIEL